MCIGCVLTAMILMTIIVVLIEYWYVVVIAICLIMFLWYIVNETSAEKQRK